MAHACRSPSAYIKKWNGRYGEPDYRYGAHFFLLAEDTQGLVWCTIRLHHSSWNKYFVLL